MKNFLIIIIKFLGAVLLITGGLLGVISMISNSSASYTGSKWIEVPAEITYTYSIQAYGGRTSSGLEYAPHPVYTFVANDGKYYKGSTYSTFFGTTKNLDFLSGATETPVTVSGSIFYNPNNPNQSAVVRPPPFSAFAFVYIVFGLLPLSVVVAGCILFRDTWKSLVGNGVSPQ